MPGHSPHEAEKNYLDPLQRAVSCLKGTAKIIHTKKTYHLHDQGSWMLNGPTGMELPKFGTFYAQQRYELVECDPERFDYSLGRFRVSTRMYTYKLVANEGWEIRWHWHPGGNSPEERPHIHPSMNLKAHLPTARQTLEEVVEGVIVLGAQARFDDWKDRLAVSDAIHKLHRTWVNDPAEQARTEPSA